MKGYHEFHSKELHLQIAYFLRANVDVYCRPTAIFTIFFITTYTILLVFLCFWIYFTISFHFCLNFLHYWYDMIILKNSTEELNWKNGGCWLLSFAIKFVFIIHLLCQYLSIFIKHIFIKLNRERTRHD